MALYLSTTIRLHRQTSVIQQSLHAPPICLIKVRERKSARDREIEIKRKGRTGNDPSKYPQIWSLACLCTRGTAPMKETL